MFLLHFWSSVFFNCVKQYGFDYFPTFICSTVCLYVYIWVFIHCCYSNLWKGPIHSWRKGWPWLLTGAKQGWSCLQLQSQRFQHHPSSALVLFRIRLSSVHEKPFHKAVGIFCGFHCHTVSLYTRHSLGFMCCSGFGSGNCMPELYVMTNITVT